MKKRNIVIISVLAVVCIALAVVLFIFSRNNPVKTQQTTQSATETTTAAAT